MSESVQPPSNHSGSVSFPETRWSLVMKVQTGDEEFSKKALADLCAIYWYPLYSWLRRRGNSPEDAEDLVQSWFASLLKRNDFARLARENGRLRTFFLTSLRNISIKNYRKAKAQKRGGEVPHIAIDRTNAEARYAIEPMENPQLTPDRLFDRAWATLLLERVFTELRTEYQSRDAEGLFDELKEFIAWNSADHPLKEVAEKFGMKEGAVRVAVLRLRKRFRRLLEREIQQTIADGNDLDEEIAFLHHIFAR